MKTHVSCGEPPKDSIWRRKQKQLASNERKKEETTSKNH